ncbi:hypothetical protein E2C01_073664 [Portunus trituberculatus]|uniref:Uncharacterized protein n=1 Tax=Portunus trituberculatus TaxID=210409 RepID=A0A5B7I1A8_PORTR|nr:hypothetical protein [Portunus trituberculatus]
MAIFRSRLATKPTRYCDCRLTTTGKPLWSVSRSSCSTSSRVMLSWVITLSQSPPTRKPLPRVRKPNLHSDRGQDLNQCAWRPLGPQSTHGSTVPQQPNNEVPYKEDLL